MCLHAVFSSLALQCEHLGSHCFYINFCFTLKQHPIETTLVYGLKPNSFFFMSVDFFLGWAYSGILAVI